MKTNKLGFKLVCVSMLSAASAAVQAQSFSPGNLVVLQDGNGGANLSNAGTAIFLDQYSTSGGFVSSLAIPSTGANALVDSGSAASEGALSLSANGQFLVFAGYNVAAGTAGVGSAASATVPRALGTVDSSGNFSLAATTSSFYTGNNMRGGTSDGLGNFWGAGAASGTVYLGTGTAAQISTVNSVAVQDLNGNLFYSTTKGTSGIYEIAGNPVSGTATPTLLLPNASPSDFAFNASMTVAYVANSSGGIQAYDFNGTAWVARSYILDSASGINSLAVDFSGPNAEVYATTEDGKNLIEITDIGAGSTTNTLATVDGKTEAFRGLDFTPQVVPEPSTLALAGGGLLALAGFRRYKKNRA